MEVFVVVFNIQVETLEELVIPKLMPLVLPEIGVGIKVILIDNITHVFEAFRTPNTIVKDTLVTKRPKFQPVPLVKLVDTIGE